MRDKKFVQVTAPVVSALSSRLTVSGKIRRYDQAAATVVAHSWGWLPALSLVSAVGLSLVSLADIGARNESAWAEVLFWAGLLVLYVPIAGRLAWPNITRRESIGLVLMLGLALYLVKILHSPLAFTQHDEFYHWRTTTDILKSGQLFQYNPLLPASAVYPGMENVTAALVSLSGLSIFSVGAVLIGVARLVLTLALYLFYEQISQSMRVAGFASVLYMASPNYLFFVGMFKYESLALPFVALTLYALVRRERRHDISYLGLTVLSLLALGLIITTHHTTSYAFTILLALWAGVARYRRRSNEQDSAPSGIALLALVASLTWLMYVGTVIVGYLAPRFESTIIELIRLIARDPSAGRELFGPSSIASGVRVTPVWERVIGFASVGLILLGLPFGMFQIWRRYRTSALALTLAAVALAYPTSLALRLTKSGWELGNRSSELVFVVVGFVLAVGIVELWVHSRLQRIQAFAFVACASVIFIGGVIVGWPPLWRLPGPYLVNSGTRSVEPESVAMAEWVRSYLGPNNRVGAYGMDTMLLGSYGEQHIMTSLSGGVDVEWVLLKPNIESDRDSLLQRGQVQYLVTNRRLDSKPGLASRYWAETKTGPALAKFDHIKHVSRIFDSGNMLIYNVETLARVP
jgi:hypothetical protein